MVELPFHAEKIIINPPSQYLTQQFGIRTWVDNTIQQSTN